MNDLNKITMKNLSAILILLLGLSFNLQAQAQAQDEVEADEASTFSFAGSVDAYYRANFNAKVECGRVSQGRPLDSNVLIKSSKPPLTRISVFCVFLLQLHCISSFLSKYSDFQSFGEQLNNPICSVILFTF